MNIRATALLSLLSLFSLECFAEVPKYNLSDLISKAVEKSPEIKEANFSVEEAKGLQDEAQAGHYGIIDFVALTGLQTNARESSDPLYVLDGEGNRVPLPEGGYLNTRDGVDSYHGLGPFIKGTFTAAIPVWTWGKLDGYINAAKAGIGVKEAEATVKRGEVINRIKEFFYGYLLASDALDLGKEIEEYLDKAIKKAKELLEKESGEVSQTDLERLLVGKAELDRQISEAKHGFPLARSAIAAFCGVEKEFSTNPSYLEMEQLNPDSLENLVDIAWQNKPELKQLAMGLEARKNLLEVEKSEQYPLVFLGARFFGGASGARDVNKNPFLNDDGFGPLQGGPALGLKWNLNYWTTNAKIAQANARYRGLKAKEEFAMMGVPVEIEQAYSKVLEHRDKARASLEGSKAARSWMVASSNNFEVGIGDAKTLLEGIGAYAMMKINLYKARYDYNMSIAKLSQLVGQEVSGLKY